MISRSIGGLDKLGSRSVCRGARDCPGVIVLANSSLYPLRTRDCKIWGKTQCWSGLTQQSKSNRGRSGSELICGLSAIFILPHISTSHLPSHLPPPTLHRRKNASIPHNLPRSPPKPHHQPIPHPRLNLSQRQPPPPQPPLPSVHQTRPNPHNERLIQPPRQHQATRSPRKRRHSSTPSARRRRDQAGHERREHRSQARPFGADGCECGRNIIANWQLGADDGFREGEHDADYWKEESEEVGCFEGEGEWAVNVNMEYEL